LYFVGQSIFYICINKNTQVMLMPNKSFATVLLSVLLFSCSGINSNFNELDVNFNGHYGQIEIGGKFVGAEFHQSRPLPSRISFYYPVANSIVSNADYWQRHKSFILTVLLKTDGITDTIGSMPYSYRYAPYRVKFENVQKNFNVTFSYDVCEDIPVLVLRLRLKNISADISNVNIETSLKTSLRTSHSFRQKNKALVRYLKNNMYATATYNDIETDSSVVFIANAGEIPVNQFKSTEQNITDPVIQFSYVKNLESGEEFEITQLVGMCKSKESVRVIDQALMHWQKSLNKNQDRILNLVQKQSYFSIDDSVLMQTMYWSKAVLASNIHYINGHYLPMPCPAEYNFFFTHDYLLTSLGAVNYDLDYVKNGLHFLRSLSQEDSILAHAYYWKDSKFATEYCASDNWNNMWVIIVACSYLKHSGDYKTLELLFPILKKSLVMMQHSKGDDDLMYAKRPDWWDIGNVYGARVYNTALAYKALQDYVYILSELNKTSEPLHEYINLAARMKKQFVDTFWDKKSGYLMNMLDRRSIDTHYYSGSLVSIFFGLLDAEKEARLLETAENILLDTNIGIRNAMPPDFHELISAYQFNGMEAGEPYIYFNGAVWPQGNIWYALGLLSNNQLRKARDVLKKYLTLRGVENSPNGQPSFYEYRITNPQSPRYGEIDKPTFLWAGGWYLYTLYRLAGLRENSSTIFFHPELPDGFDNAEYDMTLYGKLCRIKWRGDGTYFQQIRIDGLDQYSAVISSPASEICFIRGEPETPYLAESTCQINKVVFQKMNMNLSVDFTYMANQYVFLRFVSPVKLKHIDLNGSYYSGIVNEQLIEGIYTYVMKFETTQTNNKISLYFSY